MITKQQLVTSGLSAGTDELSRLVSVNVAAGGTLLVGTPILRDVTQLPGGLLPVDNGPSRAFFNARITDAGVLATTSSAGDVLGVFQGLSGQNRNYVNSGTTAARHAAYCRANGLGRVLAGAVAAGTAVTIGSNLIVTNSNVFATVGTRAIGVCVGKVTAYAVNTSSAAAIATGSQTVTPVSMNGITTGAQLTIDTGTLQEVVIPTAVTQTTFTATFAQPHAAGVLIQGITSAYGATIIQVPATGTTTGVVYADINGVL